jgi:hypothetical protein
MAKSDPKRIAPTMDQLIGELGVEDLKQLAEDRFEDDVVNHLFSRYKLDSRAKQRMLQSAKLNQDHPHLTLAAFYEEFPSFPVYLVARKFPKIREESPVHKIFMDFANRQYTKAYDALADVLPEDVWTYGLVFHWGYLKRTGRQKVDERASALVLHNRNTLADAPGVRLRWWGADREEPLFLEPLATLLTTIDMESPGERWQPDV